MINSVQFFSGSRTRRVDLTAVKSHTLRIFNQMHSMIQDLPKGVETLDDPDALFLFGGYSWRHASFRLWTLHYNQGFTFAPIHWWPGKGQRKMVRFEGSHRDVASENLRIILAERGRLETGGLDMEPFEVLRDMIRSGNYPEIGGPPQVAKVYKHLNAQVFAIPWRDDQGEPIMTLVGRPALSYERTEVPMIDPDGPFHPTLPALPSRDFVGESEASEDELERE